MTDTPNTRLAAALAVWAKAEIERGFTVYSNNQAAVRVTNEDGSAYVKEHVTWSLGGVKEEGASLRPCDFRATLENAARALVERFKEERSFLDLSPDRYVFIWRTPPELEEIGTLEKRVKAYCRFTYVRKEDEMRMLDCVRKAASSRMVLAGYMDAA